MKYKQILLTVAAMVLTACQSGGQTTEWSPNETLLPKSDGYADWAQLDLENIEIPNSTSGAVSERGVLTVPVNRATPDGESINIEFFRFHRLPEADSATPPLFLLRGGPGYPGLGKAIENDRFYKQAVYHYTKTTDLIIVGQRGFGTSGGLPCDSVAPSTLDEVSNSSESLSRYRRTAEACREKYLASHRDLSGYNIGEMADDIADVARLLGYEKIQLSGTSFGSFWAMAVIRQHPDLVARAVLSALEGPDHTFDSPSAVKAAFEEIANSAARSARYKDRIPKEGLLNAYQAVIARAEASPIPVSFLDEKSGQTISYTIDADALRRFTYGVSSRPVFRYFMQDWPDDLLKIIEGDFSDVAPRLYQYQLGTDADNAAEEIIECSSGISAARRRAINKDPARSLINPPVLFNPSVCEVWDDALVKMDTSDFVTDVPVVLVQGTWDISTPFTQAIEVRKFFANQHFVTVEGGSHGALREAEESDSDFLHALDRWYASGDLSNMPEVVTLAPFVWSGEGG